MLTLVKTDSGQVCDRCESTHFAKSHIGWHCLDCKTYYPDSDGFASLKKNLERLHQLQSRLKFMRQDLEKLRT